MFGFLLSLVISTFAIRSLYQVIRLFIVEYKIKSTFSVYGLGWISLLTGITMAWLVITYSFYPF